MNSRWMLRLAAAGWLMALAMLTLAADAAATGKPAELSDDEKKAGWKLLFDGTTKNGWRGYKKTEFPTEGWIVEDGCLFRKSKGGDIVTTDEYENYELSLEWKIAKGGNSGVKYRVIEDSLLPGPEMQILDDAKLSNDDGGITSAGSAYHFYAPNDKKKLKPVGEFNLAGLKIQGNHVEHWLNGEKIVEYEINSDEWKALKAKSPFAKDPKYAQNPKGRILLQDHNSQVWFRNIKIRKLPGTTK